MRILDRIAQWLHDSLSARARLRFGILTVISSIPWTILSVVFTDEPANVLIMSGAALFLTGITIVVAAEVLERDE
jgi:Mn2+/Fe2+ NRAMP family transporter